MQNPTKLELRTEEESTFAPCLECDRETNHKTLASIYALWNSEHVDGDCTYRIIQCQGCLEITFSTASTDSENVYYTETDLYHPISWKYYPNRITGRGKMREHHYLPSQVASIYDETHASLCADRFIMAGFGIRAIVEAVCNDKNIAGRNLQLKIDGLRDAGHITKDGALILHNLRFMGNKAAHELKTHKRNELEAGFDVLEHLLQGVYVVPQQAKGLPQHKT